MSGRQRASLDDLTGRVEGIPVYRYGRKPSQAQQVEVDDESTGGCRGYVCEL